MSKWDEFAPVEEEVSDVLEVWGSWANWKSPVIVIDKPNIWGFSLKYALRHAAKKTKEYWLPVNGPVVEHEGKEIAVNTLGRWAFGVPGWRGRLMFEGGTEDKIVVHYPAELSPEAESKIKDMIKKAADLL